MATPGPNTAIFEITRRRAEELRRGPMPEPQAGAADKKRQADAPDGWAAGFDLYTRHRLNLHRRRLDIPHMDRLMLPTCKDGTQSDDGAFRARNVRRAGQSDLAVVQRISADAYIAAYVPVLGYIPLPAEEDYRPRIERGEVWLLVCDGSDVGVVVLEERPDHLLVYSIAVRPTEQGRGHGGALLGFADQRAAALGVAVIRLYTNVRMEKNVALYRRHGYLEAGTRPHPSRVGETLVDMVRTVPPSVS